MNKEDQPRAFLRHFYNHSNTPMTLGPDSIKGIHPSNYACLFNHLKARGLLTGTMHPNNGGELPVVITAQITHEGIQAIEKNLPLGPAPVPASQTVNIGSINNQQNVVAGNNNTIQQTFDQSVQVLIDQIEQSNGSQEEKDEAKSLLRQFLEHPLVTALAPAAIGAILKALSQ